MSTQTTQLDNVEVFERLPVPRAVATMAIPTIVGQLIVLFYNMADTYFVGQTDNQYMVAGTTLILPIFNILLSLANLAGIGGGSLLSRLLGQKRPEDAKKIFTFSLYLATGTTLLFSLAFLLFQKPLLDFLGSSAGNYEYARVYGLCVITLGGIPTVLSNVMAHMLRSAGESKKASFGITMGGLVNIALDPLFMFVLLSPGNEILGAGIATCLSNCLSCLYFVIAIARLGKTSVLKIVPPSQMPGADLVKKFFSVGIPAFTTAFLFDIGYMVIDRLMSAYGDSALAAIGIVLKVERLPLNIGIGICHGMVPIVAYNYAAKNYSRMQQVIRFSRRLGLICAVVSIALYELFSPQIIRFFIGEPQTVLLGTDFLRARSLGTIMMFLCFFHVHLFNSYGQGQYSLLLGVTRWVVFNIPLLYLFNWLFGVQGIVWTQFVADGLTMLLSVLLHRNYTKKHILNEAAAPAPTSEPVKSD